MFQTRHFKLEKISNIQLENIKNQLQIRMLKVEITNEGHQRWQVVKAESSETFANNIHDDD